MGSSLTNRVLIMLLVVVGAFPLRYAHAQIMPQPNDPISDERLKALQIYKRLNGISTPIDNPVLKQMEDLIKAGNSKAAARIAMGEREFYNSVVKEMAARMSTKDESVAAPLSDFVATFIGVTRDDIDAKELLTGNFFYRADTAKAAVPSNMLTDFLKSNNHYAALEAGNYDLAAVLIRSEGQKLANASGGVADHPDPAGVLTSRAFMEAHASAGTNRRLVEYTFREFLCIPMIDFADATGSDELIGRDVDRFPGGSNEKFQVTCKACHSNHDPLRGAFARFDFADGYVKNALLLPAGTATNQMKQDPIGIAAKMNQNSDVFPEGHKTEDTYFRNQSNRGANMEYFGWRGWQTGSGVNQFGAMIAHAEAFSRCMVQRVFESVCRRKPAEFEKEVVRSIAVDFEKQNYKLKYLFETIVTRPECLGQ